MIKKNSLSKRYNVSYASKDGNTTSKKGVINYKSYDGEVSFFKMTEGRHRINIIPYTIKSKNHPLVASGDLEIGNEDYVMDLFVHRNVGASESSVVCLKQNYGKPCPICEQIALYRKQGKDDEANALKASRRVFYNVEDLKEPGKVKVLETSHFLFEKELIDEARNSAEDEDDGFIDFANAKSGKEIKFRCEKVSQGGYEYNKPKNFSFVDRDEPLDKSLLADAISFDELLIVPTAEEIEKILFNQEDDEDEDDEEIEKPSKKSSKKVVEESEDDEEEEVEEKPAKKSKSKKVVDEDEDDSEEDDEDEKPAKSSKKKCDGNCGKCKFGHVFGTDCDEFDDCEDCDIWDDCVKHQN